MTGFTTWLERIALVIFLGIASAGALSAQTRPLPMNERQDTNTLSTAASEELRRLQADGGRIETRRRNDSVLNGALIGAAAGLGSGLLLCRAMEPWEVCNDPGPLLRISALGAAIGIGIDALIRERETVYPAAAPTQLHVAPMVGRGAKGVQLGLRF
jgi:hypothetical protein